MLAVLKRNCRRQVRNFLPNLFGTIAFRFLVILNTILIFSKLSFVSNSPQQILSAGNHKRETLHQLVVEEVIVTFLRCACCHVDRSRREKNRAKTIASELMTVVLRGALWKQR